MDSLVDLAVTSSSPARDDRLRDAAAGRSWRVRLDVVPLRVGPA